MTALNATLENMILGVGKYRDVEAFLPEYKEMAERLAGMIQEILEASRAGDPLQNEAPAQTHLAVLLPVVCEPYEQTAKACGIAFQLELSGGFSTRLPPQWFSKAVSNILANAVAYTEPGKTVSICFDGPSLMMANECTPIPPEALRHVFEPFCRPDYAWSREDGGNGLELYLVDMLLGAMGLSCFFHPMEWPLGMRFVIYL